MFSIKIIICFYEKVNKNWKNQDKKISIKGEIRDMEIQMLNLECTYIENTKRIAKPILIIMVEKITDEELLKQIDEYKKENPNIRTYLGTSKGKEHFYEKFRFVSRPNEELGARMILYNE